MKPAECSVNQGYKSPQIEGRRLSGAAIGTVEFEGKFMETSIFIFDYRILLYIHARSNPPSDQAPFVYYIHHCFNSKFIWLLL